MAGIKNEEELFQTYCKIANGIYDSVEDEFLEGLRDGAEEHDIPINSDIERLCMAAYKTGVMDGIQAVVKNAEAHPDD